MNQIVSDDDKRELKLYAYNTEPLYGQFKCIIANIQRRVKRGTYKPELAPKLWLYWLNRAAQMYRKEFDAPGSKLFNLATRKSLAAEIAASEYEAIMRGEYDEAVRA